LTVSKPVVRHVQINLERPAVSFRVRLLFGLQRVSRDEDSLVRDFDTLVSGMARLTPLKIKDVVSNVVPLCAEILRRKQLFPRVTIT
jgi:hypothetical protein